MKKYEYIYNEILKQISANKLNIGEKIPSENVLSKKYNISRVTIRKSLDLLEQNGYIKKSQGKESVLISNEGHKKIVLLVLHNLFRYIFTDIIKNIEKILRENDIGLFISCSYNDRHIEEQILQYHSRNIVGIVIEPTQTSFIKEDDNISPVYNILQEVPTICLNTKFPKFDLPYLILNDKKNSSNLTRKLIEKNKKRFLLVFKTDDIQGFDRLKGITKVLNTHKIQNHIVEFSTENENTVIDEIIPIYQDYQPDCIMFYNDEFASEFLYKQKINFNEVTITGFDDSNFSNGEPFKFLSPSHPQGKMGEDAALNLIKLINGKKAKSIIYDSVIKEKEEL
ncbi:MAG: GntR family transcriptional regulator [Mycoplasmatales bacterium]